MVTATSMAVVGIADVLAGKVPVGSEVTVRGWVRSRRDSKAGLSFVHVHDGSCFAPLQVVVPAALPNYEGEVLRLTAGCAVVARGALAASQGKGQAVELTASSVEVLGWVDDPETYPIAQKRHTFEFLRDVAHLRARTNTIGAIARVRHCLSMAIHRFFHDSGFFWVHTPIITANDAEGAGQMFRVSTLDLANLPRTPEGKPDFTRDFFGRETFLTVSGQLTVETYCLALSKVYTFGPTFRAENSNTSRHLAEFWMVEPEIAFADLAADANLAERFLKSIFATLLAERADDLAFFADRIDKECVSRLEAFVASSFVRMDYGEAVAALEKSGKSFEFPVRWGMDLQSEHERWLTEEHVKRPVVVMNYPKEIKAFYMRLNDDGRTVAAMDVLAPGIGEIIGGSQREERLDVLDARLGEQGLDPKAYWWYRDLRRYGTVPHAGFGLGLERTIIYATGVNNIREVIPFPGARAGGVLMQQVLVYGDSLSWGIVPGSRRRLDFEARWPGVLQRELGARGRPVRVIEDCLNGRRTVWEDPFKPGRNGLTGLAQRIEGCSPLALVVLMLGTNDLQSMHPHTAWHAAQGVGTLVGAIRHAPIEPGMPVPPVLVVAPPPAGTPRGSALMKFIGATRKGESFSEDYLAMATELGCPFFDAGAVVAPSDVDGVHLDGEQHLVLGRALAEVAAPLLGLSE